MTKRDMQTTKDLQQQQQQMSRALSPSLPLSLCAARLPQGRQKKCTQNQRRVRVVSLLARVLCVKAAPAAAAFHFFIFLHITCRHGALAKRGSCGTARGLNHHLNNSTFAACPPVRLSTRLSALPGYLFHLSNSYLLFFFFRFSFFFCAQLSTRCSRASNDENFVINK